MKNAKNKNASPQPPLRDPKNEDHLGYLLTAYVFENLSPAGKAEVEAHLKSCAACRAQLELLRLTLGLAEEALHDEPGKTYVFEERRRQRVLEAAQRSRHSFIHRLDRPAFSFRDWRAAAIAAVAALIALVLVLPTLFTAGGKGPNFHAYGDGSYVSVTDIFSRPASPPVTSNDFDGAAPTGGRSTVTRGIDLAGGTELQYAPADSASEESGHITTTIAAAHGRASAPRKPAETAKPEGTTDFFSVPESKKSEPARPEKLASERTPAPATKPLAGVAPGTNTVPVEADRLYRERANRPLATVPATTPTTVAAPTPVSPEPATPPPPPPTEPSQEFAYGNPDAPMRYVPTGSIVKRPEITLQDDEKGARKEPSIASGGRGTDGAALVDDVAGGKPASAGTGGSWTGKLEEKAGVALAAGTDNGTLAGQKPSEPAIAAFIMQAPTSTTEVAPKQHIRMSARIDTVNFAASAASVNTVTGVGNFGTDNRGGFEFGAQTTEDLRRRNAQMEAQLAREKAQRQQGQGGATAPAASDPAGGRAVVAGDKANDTRDVQRAAELREKDDGKNKNLLSTLDAVETISGGGVNGYVNVDEESRRREERVKQLLSGRIPVSADNGKAAEVLRKLEEQANAKGKGVVIKQQQAVVVDGRENGRASGEKTQLSAELKALKDENATLSRDLSRQTQRIQGLIEKGVPVYSLMNEDAAATQPVIQPDPATAAARTGPEAKAKAEDMLQQLAQQEVKGEQNDRLAKQNADSAATHWHFKKEVADGTQSAVEGITNSLYFDAPKPEAAAASERPREVITRGNNKQRDRAILDQSKSLADQPVSAAAQQSVAGRYVVPTNKPAGSPEEAKLDAQIAAIRAKLPEQALKQLEQAKQLFDTSTEEGRLAAQADTLNDQIQELRRVDQQLRGEEVVEELQAMQQALQVSKDQLQNEVAEKSRELTELKRKIVRQSNQSTLQNQLDNPPARQERGQEREQEIESLALAQDKLESLNFAQPESTVRFGEEKPVQLGQQGQGEFDLYGWKETNGKEGKKPNDVAGGTRGANRNEDSYIRDDDKDTIAHTRREHAAMEALSSRERETDLFKARVGKMMEQVQDLSARGDHKSAENMAKQVLKVDPLNAAAEELKTKSSTLALLEAEKQKDIANTKSTHKQEYREAMLNVDEASVANGPLIVYPQNWDQISKRGDSAALGVAARDDDAWKRDIKKKLQGKVSFDYTDKPLEEVVKELNEKTNAGIVLDPKVLESKGKTPISLRVTDMSADLALEWVTRLAEVEYNLRDQKAVVSESTKPASAVELKILDVRDVAAIQDFPGPRVALPAPITLLRPRLDPQFPSRIDANNTPPFPTVLTAESLADTVKKHFANDFADPATAIEESGGKLVIMAPPETHAKITAYIDELRKQSGAAVTNTLRQVQNYESSAFDPAPEILEKLKTRDLGAGVENKPAGFSRQMYSKAFGSPTLLEGQQLNLINLGRSDERTLRAFNYLREQSKNTGSVTLTDFLKRPAPIPAPVLSDEGLDEDAYIEKYGTRPFVDARRDKLSTFSMDVDTASYTLARSRLNANELPDPATVRVEEFVNYFKQPYKVEGTEAFAVFAEAAPSPFHRTSTALSGNYVELAAQQPLQVLKIGIKSRDPKEGERKSAQLTFAIDTSGSMTKDDRLTLVRGALKNLVESLKPEDSLAIVTFADQAQVALPRTQARQKQRILDAIDALHSNGGTSVEAGLNLAYRLADESFSPDAVNRVILCSDGVANIGAQGPAAMLKTVKVFADRGIDLAAVGFGNGQYNDEMLVKLANSGNGSCHFVDSEAEAQRVFSEQLPPNLSALARDAKVQVEFNPETVSRYRLLGYEKRKIADKDFRNDKIDAGEVQHSTLVTALYEIERVPAARGALGKVFLRWKDAGHRHLPVVERNFPLDENIQSSSVESAPVQLRFLACVARFAELLRDSKWVKNSSYADVLEQLKALPEETRKREDVKEVISLVEKAQKLSLEKWTRSFSP